MDLKIKDELLDRHQTAAEIGISYNGVIRIQAARDGLKWVKIGKKHMTTRAWIREFLDRRAVSPNPSRRGRR